VGAGGGNTQFPGLAYRTFFSAAIAGAALTSANANIPLAITSNAP
jgi:hypothetical protein